MYLPPAAAEDCEPPSKFRPEAREFRTRKSVVLAQQHRTLGTIQLEYCFLLGTDDVHMRWSMIIRVDNDAEPSKAIDGGHALRVTG
jgi:hypothetical protein